MNTKAANIASSVPDLACVHQTHHYANLIRLIEYVLEFSFEKGSLRLFKLESKLKNIIETSYNNNT